MLKSLSVSQKAIGAFLILAIICSLTGIATVVNILSAQQAEKTRSEIQSVTGALNDLRNDMVEHAFVGDTYLLSSEIRHQEAFSSVRDELATKFADFNTGLTGIAPELVTEFEAATVTWKAYAFDWMGEQALLMQRPDTVDYARARESEGEGRHRFGLAVEGLAGIANKLSALETVAGEKSAQASSVIMVLAISGALITLGVTIALGFLFNAMVSRPLRKVCEVTQELADGNVDVIIPDSDIRDEVGDLSRALKVFQTNLKRTRELEAEQTAAKARAEEDRRKMLADVARSFEAEVMTSISEMAASIGTLKGMAGDVMTGADEAGQRAYQVSSATIDSASNITAVAGASEEMSATIADISGRAHEVARMAGEGETAALQVRTQVEQLSKVVGDIESVVRLIADIAEQTNLLALNATIEAARAGDAGRGFAVVATEVKELASQTAKATGDVARQIEQIRQSTEGVATASDTVNTVIEKLNDISGAIAAAMEQQGASTREIASNVERAAQAANSVSDSISEVARISQETGASSSQIGREASHLIERAQAMHKKSGDFVSRLLAG